MIDFEKRLKSLKDRRQGSRERAILESTDNVTKAKVSIELGLDPRTPESFELLKQSAGIKYAIGAMAPVKRESTEISIREGDRVADNLISSLARSGEHTVKRMQGSVALDIHIEKHSDVDMLIIASGSVFYEAPAITTYHPKTDPRDMIDIVRDIRVKSEEILPLSFPAAKVDCSKKKSIAIEGGSLLRKVDIVPALWYDSIDYQRSGKEFERGIDIYHKDHQLVRNFPFRHIYNVELRDTIYDGNLKRVIRLLKNIVADMPDYKKNTAKNLTSYDLAAIAYHMGDRLKVDKYLQLGLVENIRLHLSLLELLPKARDGLFVPDGTRKIFDSEKKVDALKVLSAECDDLAKSIHKELAPYSARYDSSVIQQKSVA